MKAPKPPSGALWLHEIKHDGFRVIARKDGPRVKLYSRPGNDLTDRFSLIVERRTSVFTTAWNGMGRRVKAGRSGISSIC
jgi:bifunctional non-homologous end joining protein LigD